MKQYIMYFIQSLILLLLTPLFIGFVKSLKALVRGYKGFPLLQPYYNIMKLFNKGRVLSINSSFITLIGPFLSLTAAVTSAFLIPVFYTGTNNFAGNLFIIIFLLAVIKLLNALLGLDCASTFGGMGSSREMFISMLAEPIVFVIITFLFIETKAFNIYNIALVNSSGAKSGIGHIIAGIAFFIVIMAENARMPVDNPETHLELTMIHEAMILDISGRDLALLELSSYIKLMVFLTILINGFLPFGIATSLSAALLIKAVVFYIIKMLICLSIISFTETVMAKFRLFRVPETLAAALALSVVAIAISYFV